MTDDLKWELDKSTNKLVDIKVSLWNLASTYSIVSTKEANKIKALVKSIERVIDEADDIRRKAYIETSGIASNFGNARVK